MKTNYEKIYTEQDVPAMIKVLDKRDLQNIETPVEIAPHWHRSLELTFVRKGEVNLWINNHKQVIKEGEFILVNSGQIHKLDAQYPEECETIIVIISYQFLKKNFPDMEHLFFDINRTDEQKDRLRELYETFRTLDYHPNPYQSFMTTACIYEILYILMNHYQDIDGRNQTQMSLKKHEVLDFIEDHYQEDLSLHYIAQHFYMSEEHFSRAFHDFCGINFKAYLTNYRLYCSFRDVVGSEKSMQDIAFEHGFSNVKAFITAFKKSYHLTPYQYRKQQMHKK